MTRKVAVITGAASGIGQALAVALPARVWRWQAGSIRLTRMIRTKPAGWWRRRAASA